MDSKIDIAIIGECLIELAANGTLADTSTLNKYFGGDTVTTAGNCKARRKCYLYY